MVVSFSERGKEKAKVLYEWATKNMKELGCIADPIRIKFESDHLVEDPNGCMMSIFIDEESGVALLRRDWTDVGAVQFNVVLNYGEIREIAPYSLKHMEDNGRRLYEFYNADVATRIKMKKRGHIPFYKYDH